MSTFVMTIDFNKKEIDVRPNSGIQPDPGSVEITSNSVRWSFMRGFVHFNRNTGELDWNTTAEYEYLEAIGHPASVSESNFKGRMQCHPGGEDR